MNEREKAQRLVTERAQVTANLLTWLAVHGNLCLALRHPANRGASRRYVVEFVRKLGKMLVLCNVISEEQLKQAEKLEMEEGGLSAHE